MEPCLRAQTDRFTECPSDFAGTFSATHTTLPTLQDICSPLIGALSKSENGVPIESFGAAHCLKALVDSEDVWRRASDGLVDVVCSETAEVLRVDGAAIFLRLACSLARCAEYCLFGNGVQDGLYRRVQFVMDRSSLHLCKE
jgi:hypothetical protein